MLSRVLSKSIINRWSNFVISTSVKCSMHNHHHMYYATVAKRIYHIMATNSSYNDKI